MAKIITITGIDNKGGLILDDHGKTHADHKEEISWHIKQNCGVESIIDISAKAYPPNPQIWANEPDQVGGSKNWKGTIKSSGADGLEWNYNIEWDDGSGGPSRVYDPKIIVNSSVE